MPVRKVVEIGLGVLNGLAAAHERGIASSRSEAREHLHHRRRHGEDPRFRSREAVAVPGPRGRPERRHRHLAADDARAGARQRSATWPGAGARPSSRPPVRHSCSAQSWSMLTGRRAFQGRDGRHDDGDSHLGSAGSRERTGRNPAAINAVIRRCMEKDTRERFQSARDLAFALQAVATETRKEQHPRRRPHGAAWSLWLRQRLSPPQAPLA